MHHRWGAHCCSMSQVSAIPEKVYIQFRRVWPKHMAPSVASAHPALSCQCTPCSDQRQKLPPRQRSKTTWQAISGELHGNAALHATHAGLLWEYWPVLAMFFIVVASAASSSPGSHGRAVGARGTVQSWMPSKCLQRLIQLLTQRSP